MKHTFQIAGFVLLLIMQVCSLHAQPVEELMEKGNEAFNGKAYRQAQQWYEQAIAKDADFRFPEIYFNLGNALYHQGNYPAAIGQFNKILKGRAEASLKSAAAYNTGNIYLQQQDYNNAVAAYKNALRFNPNDADARYNLAYTVLKVSGGRSTSSTSNSEDRQREQFQPPPPANLSPEDLKRLLDELNASENQTLQRKPKPLQQSRKPVKDW